MEFRKITETDRDQVEELWDYCFEKREEPFFQYYFQHYCYEQNVVWGAFAEGKLQSMLHLNPYTLSLRGKEEDVPYVVGVATAEVARGKHLMGELLKACFTSLRIQGKSFVYLMPIYAGIYLPYGFAFCYERLKYCWLKGQLSLPALQEYRNCYSFIEGDIGIDDNSLEKVLSSLYDVYIRKLHGAPRRSKKDWQKLLGVYAGDGFKYALVYRGGAAVGYLLYGVQESCVSLVELISLEAQAKLALLAYAEGLEVEAERCEWLAEAWDKTYLGFKDAAQAPQKLPFMMARCLNVVEALKGLSPAPKLSGVVVLKVEDQLLPENSCVLALHCQAGKLEINVKNYNSEPDPASNSTQEAALVEAAKTNNSKECSSADGIFTEVNEPCNRNCLAVRVDITMDIAAFTQLYFGLVSAKELWEAGSMQCSDAGKLELLTELLPKKKNWLNEYY